MIVRRNGLMVSFFFVAFALGMLPEKAAKANLQEEVDIAAVRNTVQEWIQKHQADPEGAIPGEDLTPVFDAVELDVEDLDYDPVQQGPRWNCKPKAGVELTRGQQPEIERKVRLILEQSIGQPDLPIVPHETWLKWFGDPDAGDPEKRTGTSVILINWDAVRPDDPNDESQRPNGLTEDDVREIVEEMISDIKVGPPGPPGAPGLPGDKGGKGDPGPPGPPGSAQTQVAQSTLLIHGSQPCSSLWASCCYRTVCVGRRRWFGCYGRLSVVWCCPMVVAHYPVTTISGEAGNPVPAVSTTTPTSIPAVNTTATSALPWLAGFDESSFAASVGRIAAADRAATETAGIYRTVSLKPEREAPLSNRPWAVGLFSNGYHQFWQGEYTAALELFDAAIELYPEDTRFWLFKGFCELSLGDTKAGQASLGRGIAVQQRHPNQDRTVAITLQRIQGSFRRELEMARLRAAIPAPAVSRPDRLAARP